MQAIKVVGETIHNILFKPYSEDILGYKAIIDDCGHFIIINSYLSQADADKACSKLIELSTDYPLEKFILLQANGIIQTAKNINLQEMRDAV